MQSVQTNKNKINRGWKPEGEKHVEEINEQKKSSLRHLLGENPTSL